MSWDDLIDTLVSLDDEAFELAIGVARDRRGGPAVIRESPARPQGSGPVPDPAGPPQPPPVPPTPLPPTDPTGPGATVGPPPAGTAPLSSPPVTPLDTEPVPPGPAPFPAPPAPFPAPPSPSPVPPVPDPPNPPPASGSAPAAQVPPSVVPIPPPAPSVAAHSVAGPDAELTTPGHDSNIPTLDGVRAKIEGRAAHAVGQSELDAASVEGRHQAQAEEERAKAAASALERIRASLSSH